MELFNKYKRKIPYNRFLKISVKSQPDKPLYCRRVAHAVYNDKKRKYELIEGIWNEFPSDGQSYIPYSEINSFKVLETKKDLEEYEKYRMWYYETYPVELYLPECRDELTNKFLKWLNKPNVQEGIRDWVDGYGYSDAYNWESPDILIEHIWKAGYMEGSNNKGAIK